MPKSTNSPERILVTRTDRIGDLVLSTPVFAELRKKFPHAWIAAMTFIENQEILAGNPHLDEVILYDKKGSEKGLWGNLIFALKLRRRHFDVVIHLHATNRMHGVAWAAGIPRRIGWNRKCSWALTQAYPDIKKEGKHHEARYNFELLKVLGVAAPERLQTYFPISSKAEKSLNALFAEYGVDISKPWVALNPSASCPSKRWPVQKFGQLVRQMAEKYDCQFFVIGTRGDRALAAQLKNESGQPVLDLTGKLSLAMLGVFLKKCALLISNDSGPVHIASALGTPVISIFGRKQAGLSPTRWGPLGEDSRVIWKDVGCQVCLAHDCQIGFLCLDVISVGDVMEQVEQFSGYLKRQMAIR